MKRKDKKPSGKSMDEEVSAMLDPKYKRLPLGPFHLKEGTIEKINNKSEPYMVVKEILFRKVAGQNNRIEVVLVLPDLDNIEVIDNTKN